MYRRGAAGAQAERSWGTVRVGRRAREERAASAKKEASRYSTQNRHRKGKGTSGPQVVLWNAVAAIAERTEPRPSTGGEHKRSIQ